MFTGVLHTHLTSPLSVNFPLVTAFLIGWP